MNARPAPGDHSPTPDFDAFFTDQAALARRARALPITLRGVTRRFGTVEVLRGIDLFIPAGQFVAIVGKSGCGKSTLLRILAGLDEPTSGHVALGEDEDRTQAARLMFQEPRLLPWSRVLGNVEVGLGNRRRHAETGNRAWETLEAVGLAERAGDWPAILSGGQKQRVALARALVSRPRFLALDEPLGALDALTRIEMQALLSRVWQSQGFTAVLVTHDVSEALTLADRVVLIENGRVTLDLPVEIPHPRRRGQLATMEERILRYLIREEAPISDFSI